MEQENKLGEYLVPEDIMYISTGSADTVLSDDDLQSLTVEALQKIHKKERVLILPPDITRYHSRAGDITRYIHNTLGNHVRGIMPALGTHLPMTANEITRMFGEVPHTLFMDHRWREDIVTLGEVPGEFISSITNGNLNFSWPAQVNKALVHGGYDCIVSIGQVVPHEVIGMANHNKNIFVGTGGSEGINKSHYIGAVAGMEQIMGRAVTPVRKVLDYAEQHFAADLPIVYMLTVLEKTAEGKMIVRGFFAGTGKECFLQAAALSAEVNITYLEKPIKKAVVYLDPEEFRSTWLGNKAIYRTRMAMADDGELIILGPGVREFGEDPEIDSLVRKYGYRGTEATLSAVTNNRELQDNLGAAAHLIHGSSEGRFTITYCPGHLTEEEITGAGFAFSDLQAMTKQYNPDVLKDGWNTIQNSEGTDEEIFFISNPAVGLWSTKEKYHS